MKRILTILMISGVLIANAQDDELRIGDMAPSLDVAKWLWGDSVGEFKPNSWYLVEFTHIDCKPCRLAIPHLTELARQYADKLTVVSIYSYYPRDRRTADAYAKDILALKHRLGDAMDVNIALDGKTGTTNRRWNGNNWFPMAYLIDQSGRLVWRGRPDSTQLMLAVSKAVLNNGITDDLQRWQEEVSTATRDAGRYVTRLPLHESIEKLDSLATAHPTQHDKWLRFKFYAYLKHDVTAANQFLIKSQQRFPTWTFSSEVIQNGPYRGLRTDLVLENFDREIAQLHDTLDIAAALVSKGSFLVKAGKPADALPLLDEAEFLRFKFGGGARTQLFMLFGWRELANYLAIRERSTIAARYWLAHRLDTGSLSRYSAIGLTTLFKDKVASEQLDALSEYAKRESRRQPN